MQAQHLAIDGSVVTIEADDDTDLEAPVTATGWAIVPSFQRAHPFTVHPPGHSELVEAAVRENLEHVRFVGEDEFSMKGGRLRVFDVEVPTAVETTRRLTVGAWEGGQGCLATSVVGSRRDDLVAGFETLAFSERPLGLAIDSRVVAEPRTPEVIKDVPGVGVVSVRPVTPRELAQIPRARGAVAQHGEVFRHRADAPSLRFLGATAVMDVVPRDDVDRDRVTAFVGRVRVEWAPRPDIA